MTTPRRTAATGSRDAAEQALNVLRPLTTRQIAHRLRQMRCHGVRGHATQCPLSKYLLNTTGLTVSVAAPFASTDLWVLRLPYSVADFARQFDAGAFAGLRGMLIKEEQ